MKGTPFMCEVVLAALKYFGPSSYPTLQDKVKKSIEAMVTVVDYSDDGLKDAIVLLVKRGDIYRHKSGWYFLKGET